MFSVEVIVASVRHQDHRDAVHDGAGDILEVHVLYILETGLGHLLAVLAQGEG